MHKMKMKSCVKRTKINMQHYILVGYLNKLIFLNSDKVYFFIIMEMLSDLKKEGEVFVTLKNFKFNMIFVLIYVAQSCAA